MTKMDVSSSGGSGKMAAAAKNAAAKSVKDIAGLPLVVALNCLEDLALKEVEILEGIAALEYVNMSQISEGKIESAAAVIVHSLAYLPRAAQRRLQPWQLVLCLGSVDKAVDSALASDLGLKLVHVDCGRAEEVADTVMALLLGLLRHTHSLAAQGFASAGWLGSIQPLCKGMRRCKGLVMGIVGSSPSGWALAMRCLAFRMKVLYFELEESKDRKWKRCPASMTRVGTLTELLAASDVISLHCPLTRDTEQIINADSLQYVKPGAVIVNTSSCHLLDDCAVKQALIDGIISGCALDGVEGPQWLEAWVREMPNVLILPKSADYSDDAWAEIREKAFLLLKSYFLEGHVPPNAVSDGEDDWQDEKQSIFEKESTAKDGGRWSGESELHKQLLFQSQEQRLQDLPSRYGKAGAKKGRRRSGRRKSQQNADPFMVPERETNWVALQRDDGGREQRAGGREQAGVNGLSRFTSPDDVKPRREGVEAESSSEKQPESGQDVQAVDTLKEGLVVAFRPQDADGYYVARQKGPGRGWCLDVMSDVTARDPAAQFLIVLRNKDRIGLRSLAAGGKLLQANKKSELLFVNHSFDLWESWLLDGSQLSNCSLINSKFRSVSLDVSMEILAAVSEEDGVARWIT